MEKMRNNACLATFPERKDLLKANIPRLLDIFSCLRICLNEYTYVPEFLRGDERIVACIPKRDHKDVGKFIGVKKENQFLLDDDIVYPLDYADRLVTYARLFSHPVVLGVHGVKYLQDYSGGMSRRRVYRFYSALSSFQSVDVLGTGTVMWSGFEPPPFEFMDGSAGFVDIRFGSYCAGTGVPRICVPRSACWLKECQNDGSKLVATVTRKKNLAILREVEGIIDERRVSSSTELPSITVFERLRIGSSLPFGLAYRVRRSVKKLERKVS